MNQKNEFHGYENNGYLMGKSWDDENRIISMVLNGDFTPTRCGDITPTIIRIELESETRIVGMTQVISRSGNKGLLGLLGPSVVKVGIL